MTDQSRCLHCEIIDAIYAYYGNNAAGQTLMDLNEVLQSLGEVMAEYLAGVDDPDERRRLRKQLTNGITEAVPVKRARGQYPQKVSVQ